MTLCKLCSKLKDDNQFQHVEGKLRRRICWTCRGKRERAKLKLDMLENLGSACECCGENHPDFLTLDHRNNDGAQQRLKYNEQQIYRLARREGWPKDKWQVLCIKCNWAKGQYGECPHRSGITAADAYDRLRKASRTAMKTRHDYKAEYRGNQYETLQTNQIQVANSQRTATRSQAAAAP